MLIEAASASVCHAATTESTTATMLRLRNDMTIPPHLLGLFSYPLQKGCGPCQPGYAFTFSGCNQRNVFAAQEAKPRPKAGAAYTPIETMTGSAGGAEGGRTPDLLIANEALSQLSYGPADAAG